MASNRRATDVQRTRWNAGHVAVDIDKNSGHTVKKNISAEW